MTTQQNQLGRLEKVKLREVWADEARDFTPWLASEANIKLLGDTLDLELEVEAQERNVGPFRADILCKDTSNDQWVLIENQLERTDHNHLGQLMTYAAGLEAVTVVWVAERFTEEHRGALDWLNKITDDDFRFFGLEVELWKIGESQIAPKFNLVSKPNDWTATVGRASRSIGDGELTATKQLQLEYWTSLWDLLGERESRIRGSKPRPQHWNSFSVGRSKFWLAATVNTQQKFIRVELSCTGNEADAYFHLLKQDQAEIQSELGADLNWQELPNRKQTRISLKKSDVDPAEMSDWPKQHAWLIETLEAFHRVFAPRVKTLNATDYEPDNESPLDDD